jgi:YegS/Rv2252/BmrU family lipid kinase
MLLNAIALFSKGQSMARYKVIVNPEAGRGAGSLLTPKIDELLRTHQLDFEIVQTERPWHAVELAKQAVIEGFQVVVAAGGDGTANEVLNGLMLARAEGSPSVMGVLPIGQGNDFAFGMSIPADLEESCQVLAQNHRRTIDVGRVIGQLYPAGRFFGNGVGVGFDTIVGFEALKLTRLHGFTAYLVGALKTIFLYFNAPQVKIELDDETLTLPALMISLMNGQRMGGGFMMAPHGDPGDGLFNLCIVEQVSRLQIFGLIPRFLQGTQGTHPAVQFKQSRRLKATALAGGVLPTHADGETISTEGKELEVEILPGQLEII